jgi:hypothetical protein
MNDHQLKDVSATVIGGGLGVDQIFQMIDALLTDGATAHEWVDLMKGIALLVLGFMAWRKVQHPAPPTATP